MYDPNGQATRYYLKDLEQQALDCIESNKHSSPLTVGPISAMIAICGVVFGLIVLIGQAHQI